MTAVFPVMFPDLCLTTDADISILRVLYLLYMCFCLLSVCDSSRDHTDFMCVYVVVKDVFIVAAKRTPFGGYGGKLLNFTTVDLQEVAFKAALAAGNVNPECVDSVVVGNVYSVSWLFLCI